jgi:LmbE family N-acetylglucosaminyl deacetylase
LPVSLVNENPISLKSMQARWHCRRRSHLVAALCVTLFVCLPVPAQAPASTPDPSRPLPQDTDVRGLKQMLLRLGTTARLMQVTAHPDDEDGGMLTLESRGDGASVLLMSLTRGEGGQNKIGSNLFDVLGVLRTLELLASDRYYGVEQRFSRVADFGYSKNPEETFQKWGGHGIALGDIVRVIRTFHPDVLIARFSGTERDGHGHHQASAILTKEAFRAAADPSKFPEQIQQGLEPWQTKKLYVGNVCGFGATSCPAENYTVRLNTGIVNPALGMSYAQFAMEGLRHQLSQGAGGWSVEPGDRFTYYKLVDSVLAAPATDTDKDGHEKDFWDGIDTSLPGLASHMGNDETKVPKLRPALTELAQELKQAADRAEADPGTAVQPLLAALERISHLSDQNWDTDLSRSRKQDLEMRLQQKEKQIQAALNFALNVSAHTNVVSSQTQNSGASTTGNELPAISPGQSFAVEVKFHNGSQYTLNPRDFVLDGMIPAAVIEDRETAAIKPTRDYKNKFELQLPVSFAETRPALHRDDPERDSVYTVDEPQFATLPFPPPPFRVVAHYDVPDLASPTHRDPGVRTYATFPEISSPVLIPFKDETGTEREGNLSVVPAFSLMLEPATNVIRMQGDRGCDVKLAVSYNLSGPSKAMLRLQLPANWRVEPPQQPVEFHERGEKQDFHFKVFPTSLQEGGAQIRAVLDAGGKRYSEGYSLVAREDLGTAYYYQPAIQRVSIVDVKIPKDLTIGYIMGAGDDIPAVLQQIGMNVTLIPAEKLASEDLNRYGTIVLGIRAYDTQKAVAAHNKKLLDFVAAGGTLVVQYNTGTGDFNGGQFTPYPAQLSRARVSVEEVPVEILAPDDRVFHYPNQITQHDFDGWVQERGLYFMSQWDGNFKPLLACHDPGEQPQKGGLLKAQYGKGTYLYTGYAFFRQLPAGIPGAVRLYVNLLSAGGENGR